MQEDNQSDEEGVGNPVTMETVGGINGIYKLRKENEMEMSDIQHGVVLNVVSHGPCPCDEDMHASRGSNMTSLNLFHKVHSFNKAG